MSTRVFENAGAHFWNCARSVCDMRALNLPQKAHIFRNWLTIRRKLHRRAVFAVLLSNLYAFLSKTYVVLSKLCHVLSKLCCVLSKLCYVLSKLCYVLSKSDASTIEYLVACCVLVDPKALPEDYDATEIPHNRHEMIQSLHSLY